MLGIFRFLAMHWKGLFILIWPLGTLPVWLFDNRSEMRCFWVLLVMGAFWVLEVLPVPVTSLIPVVAFPLLGIMDAKETSLTYMKETNMMFVGGLIIALAIEFCNLHTRISLICIKLIGCSFRRLNLGLVTLTMLVSMWISNTAATAMMIPIVEAILAELEFSGVGHTWQPEPEGKVVELDQRRPTKATMCMYISIAYAASIGGMGCVVGSGTNLVMKGLYETEFPDSPGMDFNSWLALNVPIMLATMYPTWVWLQIWYTGLCRPNSEDNKAIQIGEQGEEITRRILAEKLEAMGGFTFHEICVLFLFLLAACLWIFRKPEVIPGWAERVTSMKTGDSTAAMIVCLLLFALPSTYDFLYTFSSNEERRPTKPCTGLVTWRFIKDKMHWGLLFLLGGGFVLSEGIKKSGMGKMMGQWLSGLTVLPPIGIMMVCTFLAVVITQLTMNAAIASILMPVMANVARRGQIHPMYLMMPVGLGCSLAFTLPVSTPPNAIAAAPCNMRPIDMLKVGLGVEVIAYLVLIAMFPTLGEFIWDFTYPGWANITTTTPHSTTPK